MQQNSQKRVHFIAIGGSVMHNLAIELHENGYAVSGSDDELFEPSRAELNNYGLLPEKEGWYTEKIKADIDIVILGMHAKADNPELKKAQELGLKVVSFPEFIFEHSQDKQRVVIAGSHGKTTITAMVVHVLSYFKRKFDCVIGAKVPGLARTVRLSGAPVIIIEGDEYLSSALDPTPKFLRYQHHIGLISGIAWDHANVFPTEEGYVAQFDRFADHTPKGGILIYSAQDPLAIMIGKRDRADIQNISYKSHSYTEENGLCYLLTHTKDRVPVKIFGSHNMQNLSAAKELLKKIGITQEQFFEAIQSFEGASGRLEKIGGTDSVTVYKDFAHAPSKVRATVKAVKDFYPDRELIACLELHTYSSLSKNYLPLYHDSMKGAQKAVVYFNPEKIKAKKLAPLSEQDIKNAFGSSNILVTDDPQKLLQFLSEQSWKNKNLLLMSSGNFGGINLSQLVKNLGLA